MTLVFGQPKSADATAHLLAGNDDLEVVGELVSQAILRPLRGGVTEDRIR
jgi:hypothetical protein